MQLRFGALMTMDAAFRMAATLLMHSVTEPYFGLMRIKLLSDVRS